MNVDNDIVLIENVYSTNAAGPEVQQNWAWLQFQHVCNLLHLISTWLLITHWSEEETVNSIDSYQKRFIYAKGQMQAFHV